MKISALRVAHKLFLTILFACVQAILWAQDSTTTSHTTTTKTETTTSWAIPMWAWIGGGAVLLIILVALLRGRSTRDTEVTRTTIIKDDRG